MAVATHPSHLTRWISDNQSEVWNTPGDHCASTDERIASDGDPAHNRCVGTNGAAALQMGRFVQRVPVHLGAWIGDVRQNARWSQKDVVFDHSACVDRHIVLNLDVVPY